MDFIDLKSQQARIREDIDERIKRVLDHGQYILGPEIEEMEEMKRNSRSNRKKKVAIDDNGGEEVEERRRSTAPPGSRPKAKRR